MLLLIYLLAAGTTIYLFYNFYPWGGRPRQRSLPSYMEPRALPGRGRRRRSEKPKDDTPPEPPPFDLLHLEPGDIVIHHDQDFLVAERRTVREDSWEWIDYTLEDGEDLAILSVNDEQEETFWLTPVLDLNLSYPPPEKLTYRQTSFTLTSAGQAEIVETEERFRYYTYEESSQLQIVIAEDWGAQWELFLGEAVRPKDLQLLPGPQRQQRS
ncbi:MAG: DUF4178 domain-containing protein [Deltaproteobacteria bacterium]|nr:MAG: DUF4178 domain-containing protein [Deltaproteobacteria bacterium]